MGPHELTMIARYFGQSPASSLAGAALLRSAAQGLGGAASRAPAIRGASEEDLIHRFFRGSGGGGAAGGAPAAAAERDAARGRGGRE
ncbi:hypothetical protein Rsub_04134 [Raphidocelis subcapitata]|uniref:Uncharacterized protein n=1 Tax=Raphidocelis subcapitata TaxID=307507 RepID=A0A2V0NUS9_9CHLO|nr:hypothetical protein Rsub_04134 [Raphidocelis subcapitata]|eukprot:GBF91394.1 hypothetical protein Rsub_04134 [Raphidocelis subcapitata]